MSELETMRRSALAGFHGGVGGLEAGYAYDRGDHEVDLGQRGYVNSALGAVDYFNSRDACGLELRLKLGGELFGRDGDDAWAPTDALLEG